MSLSFMLGLSSFSILDWDSTLSLLLKLLPRKLEPWLSLGSFFLLVVAFISIYLPYSMVSSRVGTLPPNMFSSYLWKYVSFLHIIATYIKENKSDFIECCPTNVKHPILQNYKNYTACLETFGQVINHPQHFWKNLFALAIYCLCAKYSLKGLPHGQHAKKPNSIPTLISHAHFWPCLSKNYWNNFYLSWICTSMQNISSLYLFILEIKSISESQDQTGHALFWPCPPTKKLINF